MSVIDKTDINLSELKGIKDQHFSEDDDPLGSSDQSINQKQKTPLQQELDDPIGDFPVIEETKEQLEEKLNKLDYVDSICNEFSLPKPQLTRESLLEDIQFEIKRLEKKVLCQGTNQTLDMMYTGSNLGIEKMTSMFIKTQGLTKVLDNDIQTKNSFKLMVMKRISFNFDSPEIKYMMGMSQAIVATSLMNSQMGIKPQEKTPDQETTIPEQEKEITLTKRDKTKKVKEKYEDL